MKYVGSLLLVVGLGALGWGAWYLATHQSPGGEPDQPQPTGIAVQAGRLTVTGWQKHGDRAEKGWQVTAHDVQTAIDGTRHTFGRITDGIIYRDGQVAARFSAGGGNGDEWQNTLDIRTGIRFDTSGATLRTDELHWRGTQRQLMLPKPVHVTRGTLTLDTQRAQLSLQTGRLSADGLTGQDRSLHFRADHGTLRLAERRLDLFPVALRMPGGQLNARRATYFADDQRLQAQEVSMNLSISPATRIATATGLTLALLNAGAAAPGEKKGSRDIFVGGHSVSDTRTQSVITNATIRDRDTKMTANQIVIDKDASEKTERITATGKPRAVNERNEVTGDRMVVYPKQRLVVVEGNARVIVRPKPGEEPAKESDRDVRAQLQDAVLTADRIEYDYRNKNAVGKGHLKIVSRGRTVLAEQGMYYDKTEQAEFIGPVDYSDDKHRTFKTATGLKLNLKKGAEELHAPGEFTATFTVDDEEEDEATAPEEKKTAARPTTPPASPAPSAPPRKSP